jgi:hypothetical protein
MQENKSLVQEALIQMRNVEEAIAENAKGILHSTMKEEINQLVKESLSEQDEVDLDADIEDDEDTDDVEMDVDMDVDNDTEEMDMDVDTDMDMDSEDESPIDLTDASDEEILKVFKAMGEEDGIIVKKDGEDIHLTDNDADTEYLVKLGESEEDEINMNETDEIMNQTETDESVQDVIDAIFSKNGDTSEVDIEDVESDDDNDDVVYEIHLDDESDEDEYDHYRGAEKDDAEHIYDLEKDMEHDSEYTEQMDDEDFDDEDEMFEQMDDEDFDDEDEMFEQMNDEDFDDEEEMFEQDEEEFDDTEEESIDETYNHRRAVREGKSTVKPKGVGIGSGPKFTYKNKAAGGFKEDKKEGPKSVGTGKAKFEYKKGANMEGKSKVVKAETKESWGSKKDEFKRKKVDGVEKKAGTKDGHYKDYEKTETKEAARTYGNGSKEGRGLRKGITNNRNYVYSNSGVKVESTEAEVSMLREKNEEYRKALNIFREKLNEVAIFNSNLAYATRLFTEHSTTKKEKINILRRFDGVETLKESKSLYKSIKDELSTGDTQPITESVGSKLNKQVSTGSSVNLIESKTYENPQFLRMKDLMSKIS